MTGMADQSGQQLGNYHLNRLLGKGGFGAVYHATHLLLRRDQAVKVLLEDYLSDPKALERFLREAQTLAKLDHPNIVHVDELGIEGNIVYLVMPYHSGGTLQTYLKQHAGPLSLEETGRILEQASTALDYAHRQGVAHLDLKPLNLLRHQDGRWLLSDFGLAHLMQTGALIGGTSLSLGTPQYMAPEHVMGQPERRSDLYALGCILYQLLTGHLPYEASIPQAIMFKHVSDPLPKLNIHRRDLPVALEAVIAKILSKKPEERHQTAEELFAAFRLAIGSSPRTGGQTRELVPPAPAPGAVHPIASQPPAGSEVSLTLKGHSGWVIDVAWSPDGRRLATAGHDCTIRLWDAFTGKPLAVLRGHGGEVNAVAWSPDGSLLASASSDKLVCLWDGNSGADRGRFQGHTQPVYAVAWSPVGNYLASSGWDRTVHLWSTSVSKFLKELTGHTSIVKGVAWASDIRYLASASDDKTIRIWDTERCKTISTLKGHKKEVSSLAWSPNDRLLASASDDQTIRLWDTSTGKTLATLAGHLSIVFKVAWSPDGRRLASASFDETIRLWDIESLQSAATLTSQHGSIQSVAWSPDGRLASAHQDGTVQVWLIK